MKNVTKKATIKVRVYDQEDEDGIIFVLYPHDKENSYLDEIEITEEFYNRYKKVQREFKIVQDKIYKLYFHYVKKEA